MNTIALHRLEPHAVWSCEDPSTHRAIRCVTGILWITQEGNATDIFLHPGKRFVPLAQGKIVIEAVVRASFTLEGVPLPFASHEQRTPA